jgi:uncharacterized protein (UPF0335 family)
VTKKKTQEDAQMTEISELEGRISAALDRIRSGVSALENKAVVSGDTPAAASSDDGRVAALEADLAAQKEANAQLEERVKVLKSRQDGVIAELNSGAERAKEQLQSFEADLEKLRGENAALREVSENLRKAAEGEGVDAAMINRVLQAELEALRALRAAEAAEVATILSELKPLIEEAK